MAENKELREKLFYEPKNGYDRVSADDRAAMEAYCGGYKAFLDEGKTERECVDYSIALAEAQGFVEYVSGMEVKPGDKIYCDNRGKGIMLARIGTESLAKGAHIGAPFVIKPLSLDRT